jgi:micrococcal nuclease
VTRTACLVALVALCLGVAVALLAPRPRARVGLDARPGLVVPAVVVDLLDGDTAIVRAGAATESVRFVGIDTPEISHEGKPAACFGTDATEITRRLLGDGRLTLTIAAEARDRYGRVLGYLTPATGPAAGGDLATAIAAAGAARQLRIAPNVANASGVVRATALAKQRRLGLWARCTPAAAFPGKKL